MLKIGSNVEIFDTSGALNIRILNMQKKGTKKSSVIKLNELFLGVVKIAELDKKLKRKDFVTVITVALKKKVTRGNGVYINFNKNVGIPLKITRFIVAVGLQIYNDISYELRLLKKYKVVARLAGQAF